MRVTNVSVLSVILLYVLAAHSSNPTGNQADLEPVLSQMAEHLDYKGKFVSKDELLQGDVIWTAGVPNGIKDIHRLRNGNLLVITRSNLSTGDCKPGSETETDEEDALFFNPQGILLGRVSLGGASTVRIHQSASGSLLSLEAAYGEKPMFAITDGDGRLLFKAYGKTRLYPSSRGDYLINGYLGAGPAPYRAPLRIEHADGKSGRIEAGTRLGRDGSPQPASSGLESALAGHRILWAFGDTLLLSSRGRQEGSYTWTYYDLRTNTAIWSTELPFYSDVRAVSLDRSGGRWYVLGAPFSNDPRLENLKNVIVDLGSGALACALTGGYVWDAVGSSDGFFYGNVSGRMRVGGRNSRHRLFLVKFDPRFRVARYGLLWAGYPLERMQERGGFVWGIQGSFRRAGECYPTVTAVYDMRGKAVPDDGDEITRLRADPLLLEGHWFVEDITTERIMLIGQPDPASGRIVRLGIERDRIGW